MGYWDLEFCFSLICFSLMRKPFQHPYLHRTFWNEKHTALDIFLDLKFLFFLCAPSFFIFMVLLIHSSSFLCVQILPSLQVYFKFYGGKTPLIAPVGDVVSPSLISLNTFDSLSFIWPLPLPTSYDEYE